MTLEGPLDMVLLYKTYRPRGLGLVMQYGGIYNFPPQSPLPSLLHYLLHSPLCLVSTSTGALALF